MLESLVISLLNRFLGNYVSNLNYDQLNLGIWNGEANLRDLKLRREALDKLKLPIDVLEGYLGTLTLSIPWSNLKTKPVKVFIDNVYLLAVPKSEASLTLEEEEERANIRKQRQLETWKLMESSRKQKQTSEESSNDGFVNQLMTKIVDNLQVSIKNIHIRFEDNISDPEHPFAAGVTLKELSAVSTDGEWKPTFISELTNTIHKLATLQSLSVYWNTDAQSLAGMPREEAARVFSSLIPDGSNDTSNHHQLILKPVSATGKVKLNKQFGSGDAKMDVTLLFEELGICIDDHQYRDFAHLIDLLHRNLKKQKYLKHHPPKGMTPKSNPREFLKFAGNAVLAEIHDRNYRWSWDHFRTRRDQRKAYLECYMAREMKKATPAQTEKLKKLERELSFEDIRFYRSIANSKLKQEKVRIDEEKKKKEKENINKGWFSSWWSSSTSGPQSQSPGEGNDIVITEEQKRELYDAIDYDEEKESIMRAVDIPKDTMKLMIRTKLKKGSLTLRQHSHNAPSQDLVSLVFDTVAIDAIQYPESFKVSAALNDLQLFDGLTPNTLYPQLIGVKRTGRNWLSLIDSKVTDSPKMLSSETSEPLFKLVFEHKPLNNIADNAVYLVMRHLEVIYNPTIIKGVLEFFKPPETSRESFNAILEAAGDRIEVLKQQTRAGLEYALQKHTTFFLDIDMDAPLFVIPESCTHRHTPTLIIDAGHINVDSDLANQELAKELKRKGVDKQDDDQLESLMYDKFNIGLSQTKILIGNSIDECLEQLFEDELKRKQSKRQSNAYLIEKIDMNFVAELCILQRAANFTKFKVSGNLPLLSINISDTKYKTLMRMIDLVLDSIELDNDESAPVTLIGTEENAFSNRYWDDDLLLSDTDSEWPDSDGRSTRSTSMISAVGSDGANTPISSSQQYASQEQFKFTFQVGKVSALLYETSKEDTSIDVLLCELVLENFFLQFLMHPFDMGVLVSLRSLDVIDKMEHTDKFKYLVTSNMITGTKHEQLVKDLVEVKYTRVDKKHPDYFDVYRGFDQTVEIALSTLNITVTRSSILTLYNFVLNTFTGPNESQSPTTDDDTHSKRSHSRLSTRSFQLTQKPPKPEAPSEGTIKVSIYMDSLALILNNNGVCIGTGVLSFGSLTVLLYPKTLKVTGKIGSFTLRDETENVLYDTIDGTPDDGNYLLSIKGDDLADFIYETFDPNENYPGYDQRFHLRMGTFQFMLLDSAKPTINFLSEFLEMKTVYDAAREAAIETAQQFKENATRFHFDVLIKSPVVIFPLSQTSSIVAYLGEIQASNQFTAVSRRHLGIGEARQLDVTKIHCGLYAIRLQSRTVTKTDDGKKETSILPIIDDLDITFDIENLEKESPEWGPVSRIQGIISDVHVNLTEDQYKALLDIYGKVMDTFVGGETAAKEQGSEQDETWKPPKAVASRRQSHIEPSSAPIQIDMVIKLNMVCLDLNTGSTTEKNISPLSRLSFNDTAMKMQTKADSSMLLEVQLRSITFMDTRPESDSKFKEIMSAKNFGGPQLAVQVKTPPQHEKEQAMQVLVTVDTPNIVLSLDYLIHLRDFFMGPFIQNTPTEAQMYAQSHRERAEIDNSRNDSRRPSTFGSTSVKSKSLEAVQEEQPTVLYYTVNVVDVEIICLAHPELDDSEAIVFSLNQLSVDQKQVLNCDVKGMDVSLCRMNNRAESKMTFIEPLNIGLSMDTSSTFRGYKVTLINLAVDPLVIRLSIRDSLLVLEIINKVVALMGNTSNRDYDSGKSIYGDRVLSDTVTAVRPSGNSQVESERPALQIEPYIVMSKESLTAEFKGLQFVLIEDVHDLPFIDFGLKPFTLNVSEWSRALSVDVDLLVSTSAFNFRNSHWEPLIEPWKFNVKVSQDIAVKAMNVAITSAEMLQVDITHSFLDTIFSLSEAAAKIQQSPEGSPKHVRPYLIRNYTGYKLCFWNMSDGIKVDTSMHSLENGQQCPWTFHDWKHRREVQDIGKNMLGVNIDTNDWMPLHHIPLDQEGQRSYKLEYNMVLESSDAIVSRQKSKTGMVAHRLVVDIKLENNIKVVTFRSGWQLQNNTKNPMQVTLMNGRKKRKAKGLVIDPDHYFSIPIKRTYDSWVAVRPSDDYEWSEPALHWSDLVHPKGPQTITCKSTNPEMFDFVYYLNGVFDSSSTIAKYYPFVTLQFGAPVELKNSLPLDFNYVIVDKATGREYCGEVKTGCVAYIHTISDNNALALSISMDDEAFGGCEPADIRLGGGDKETERLQPLTIVYANSKLVLRFTASHMGANNEKIRVNVFTPYLISNKTANNIRLKSRISHRHSKYLLYKFDSPGINEHVTPAMFAFPDQDRRNRVELSVEDSKWSEALSFEAVGSAQHIRIPHANSNKETHVGVHVKEGIGMYFLTKIVTFAPRFVVKNQTANIIKMREFGTTLIHELPVNEKVPLYNLGKTNLRWFSLCQGGPWSAPFDIQQIGNTHVKLDCHENSNDDPLLIKVSVSLKDATLFVYLEQEKEWPYTIENKSSVSVTISQKENWVEEFNLKDKQKNELGKPPEFIVPPSTTEKYSWDMPIAANKLLLLNVEGKQCIVDFEAIGEQQPFRYRRRQGEQVPAGYLAIKVVARSTGLVLELTDYDEKKSAYQLKDSSASTIASSSREGSSYHLFELNLEDEVISFKFAVKLAGISVSVVNQHAQELLLLTAKGLEFNYSDSDMYEKLKLIIEWIQIDNQLHGTLYPILFYPTNMPSDGKGQDLPPPLVIELAKAKDQAHEVTYYKTLNILLQEATIETDYELVSALIDFYQFSSTVNQADAVDPALFAPEISEPIRQNELAINYFEMFLIQPMRLNISLVWTDHSQANTPDGSDRTAFEYVFDVAAMMLGNINDAPVKLNALFLQNLRASWNDLTPRIIQHYQDEVLNQIYKVMGSIDVIGNPVGFFSTIGTGIGDLFYEPYQGFVMSDRPQDMGKGIARGVGGFVKSFFFGFSDSMSRITGSVGKGLSTATMDKKFQDRRRISLIRNKPRNLLYGVTQGVTYLGTSVASGVTGLVKRPMEGMQDGILGFTEGVGRGLVGVVAKPVVGMFDLVSNISAGIRETTVVFEVNDIGRVRLPRYIGLDGILKPFSEREALGQFWLKQQSPGTYINDTYIAHSLIDSNQRIAMLTYQHILIMVTQDLTVEWATPLDGILGCRSVGTRIEISTKYDDDKTIDMGEDSCCEWFRKQITDTLAQRKEEMEHQ